MNKVLRADLILFLIALIWGATFPLTREAVFYISPFLQVFLRFAVAALVLLVWIYPRLKKTNRKVLWVGLILGLMNAGVYLLQTFGMRHVDASTTAFISSVGVVFVPFLAPFFKLAKVRLIEVAGSVLCLFGLYVLMGGNFTYFNLDELLIILAALFWALSICYLQKVTPHIKELNLLAFFQIVFTLPPALICSGISYHVVWNAPVIVSILYTGILATALVFVLQVRYQKESTATHAAIIYSLEPVFASILAVYINGEVLTERIIAGGSIILGSILMIELIPKLPIKWSSSRHRKK